MHACIAAPMLRKVKFSTRPNQPGDHALWTNGGLGASGAA
jgi:hypothetical protein